MNQKPLTYRVGVVAFLLALFAWVLPFAGMLQPALRERACSQGGHAAYALFMWVFVLSFVTIAPASLLLSCVALWRQHRNRPARRGLPLAALILAALNIGVVVVPGSLITLQKQRMYQCSVNLHRIDGAKSQFAHDRYATNGEAVASEDLAPYFSPEPFPQCPSGERYIAGRIGELPSCTRHGELFSLQLQGKETRDREDRTR